MFTGTDALSWFAMTETLDELVLPQKRVTGDRTSDHGCCATDGYRCQLDQVLEVLLNARARDAEIS